MTTGQLAAGQKPVIVVGGGVVGVSCAYYLAKAGIDVLLIEKDQLCSGASYGNLGLLAASHSIPLAAPGVISKALRWLIKPDSPFAIHPSFDADLIRWLWLFFRASTRERAAAGLHYLSAFNLASIRLYEELNAFGLPFMLEHRGILELFVSPKELSEAVRSTRAITEAGLKVRVLSASETLAMDSGIQPGISGSLLFEDDWHVRPQEVVLALGNGASQLGAKILESTSVVAFEKEGQAIRAVITNKGRIDAAAIVLAAGAASSDIAHLLDLQVPVQPGRGYSFDIPRTDDWPIRPTLFGEAKVLITPMKEFIRIGGILDLGETPAREERARSISKLFGKYLSRTISLEGLQSWSGLRPCSPDGLPIIGRSQRFSNLLYATGHGMLGVTQGPITGKLIADLISGDEPALDATAFSPIALWPALVIPTLRLTGLATDALKQN